MQAYIHMYANLFLLLLAVNSNANIVAAEPGMIASPSLLQGQVQTLVQGTRLRSQLAENVITLGKTVR